MQIIQTSLLALCLLEGCSSKYLFSGETPPSVTVPRTADSGSNNYLVPHQIGKISIFELDTEDFFVNGIRIGLQDFMNSQTPILTYIVPEQADYVQILRCKANTIVKGPYDIYLDTDIGASAIPKLISNDFWASALKDTADCLQISTGVTGNTFADTTAPSGDFKYLMRACVESGKLQDTTYSTPNICSKMISSSPLLQDFQNERTAKAQQLLAAIQKLKDKIDSLGREIYYLSSDLNNALASCQTSEQNRATRVTRKECLAQILDAGTNLGLQIGVPAATIGSSQTNTDAWSSMWEAASGNYNSQTGLASALLWLFSSSKDFPVSCTAAKEIADKAQVKTQELKANSKELAIALDNAQITSQNLLDKGE